MDKLLLGEIYVMSDRPITGNSSNSSRLCGRWSSVSIKTTIQRFSHKKGKQLSQGKKKLFPGILGHVKMIHKAQGSTYYYMKGNIGHSVNSNKRLVLISQGQTNTLLSLVKSRGKGKRLNFKPSYTKVIDNALKELNWMRQS